MRITLHWTLIDFTRASLTIIKRVREREREREEAVSLLLDTLSVVCKWVNLCVSVFVYQKGFYECTLESAEFVIDDQEDTD